jgi:hypothetical protein
MVSSNPSVAPAITPIWGPEEENLLSALTVLSKIKIKQKIRLYDASHFQIGIEDRWSIMRTFYGDSSMVTAAIVDTIMTKCVKFSKGALKIPKEKISDNDLKKIDSLNAAYRLALIGIDTLQKTYRDPAENDKTAADKLDDILVLHTLAVSKILGWPHLDVAELYPPDAPPFEKLVQKEKPVYVHKYGGKSKPIPIPSKDLESPADLLQRSLKLRSVALKPFTPTLKELGQVNLRKTSIGSYPLRRSCELDNLHQLLPVSEKSQLSQSLCVPPSRGRLGRPSPNQLLPPRTRDLQGIVESLSPLVISHIASSHLNTPVSSSADWI